MIYIGLGNSGSRILMDLFDYTFPIGAGESGAIADANEYRVSDADTNNPVINDIKQRRLNEQPPPKRIDINSLETYWSGGCGVYHIIGELVADTAMNDEQFRRTIAPFTSVEAKPVTLLLSAGGGTGGGVGGYYLTRLKAANIRAVTVLPELTYRSSDLLQISGADGFQTVSSGRFLTKLLGAIQKKRLDVSGGRELTPHDAIILSNTHLSYLPSGLTYPEAFARLNRYLVHTLAFLPSPVVSEPKYRILTTGLGAAVRIPPGEQEPLSVQLLSTQLIRSALGEPTAGGALWGLDLSRPHPVGLSALPMESVTYSTAIKSLWDDKEPNASARKLQRIFRKCKSVEACLIYRKEARIKPVEILHLGQQIRTDLESFFGHDAFGGNVQVTTHQHEVADTAYLPRTDDGVTPADFILLLMFDDLMTEDVFRLVVYFLESSFPWKEGGVDKIAELFRHILDQRDPGDIHSTVTSPTGPGRPADLAVYLPPKAREYYAPRFWGNIDDLRNKVLQSLDRHDEDFDNLLLTPHDVADVLQYFHQQVWRYE